MQILKHAKAQGYDAAGFAEIHNSVDDVVNVVRHHQRIAHGAVIREMQLRKKRGDGGRTQLHTETSVTDT